MQTAQKIQSSDFSHIYRVLHAVTTDTLGHRVEISRVPLRDTIEFMPLPRGRWTLDLYALRDAVTRAMAELGLTGPTELMRDPRSDPYLVVTLQTCAFLIALE